MPRALPVPRFRAAQPPALPLGEAPRGARIGQPPRLAARRLPRAAPTRHGDSAPSARADPEHEQIPGRTRNLPRSWQTRAVRHMRPAEFGLARAARLPRKCRLGQEAPCAAATSAAKTPRVPKPERREATQPARAASGRLTLLEIAAAVRAARGSRLWADSRAVRTAAPCRLRAPERM